MMMAVVMAVLMSITLWCACNSSGSGSGNDRRRSNVFAFNELTTFRYIYTWDTLFVGI